MILRCCISLLLFSTFAGCYNGNKIQKGRYDIKFDPGKFTEQTITVHGRHIQIRAYENIMYVRNPADTTYQVMNIYIPSAYFSKGTIEGFTASTAPVFFPNMVGGFMPAKPGTAINAKNKDGKNPSAIALALSKGYVVASAGARGRTTKAGKAPALIVDLKAAVRYLKYNDKVMPGDADKIISNGTSAGGAVSVLLGATGNNKDYEPYLKALGAADASDDIFAVSAYCPITNLDNADMAYEWQFYGINNYDWGWNDNRGTLNAAQQKVSATLRSMFPGYVNALRLKNKEGHYLRLDENGNGNFKELVKAYLIASAQKAMDAGWDMRPHSFVRVSNGKVTGIDFDGYIKHIGRMKTPPAFDALNLMSAENQLFGDSLTGKKHFTRFSFSNTTAGGSIADTAIVKMMNPMYYVGTRGTTVSKHWRLRHGTQDKDTGLAISVMLATLLENNNYNVNLELPWEVPHSGDYDLEELFTWMKSIAE